MRKTLLLLLLCGVAPLVTGCAKVVEVPYTYVSDSVYACGDSVWDKGKVRARMPDDLQALQFIPDDKGILLKPGDLVYYEGTLYALSNYRELLLECGYETVSLTRSHTVLDTVLQKGNDRVRLIYQRGDVIRILFEKEGAEGHILLEGVE